jgi:hypothetical protein
MPSYRGTLGYGDAWSQGNIGKQVRFCVWHHDDSAWAPGGIAK